MRILHKKLRGLRVRLCWTEGTRRLAIALAIILIVAGLAMLIDWWIELPLTARYVSFSFQAALLSGLLVWFLWGVVSRSRRSPDDLALMIERTEPEFQGRLISAVQFAGGRGTIPEPDSQALVDDLIQDAERTAEPHAFGRAIDYRPWRRALAVCGSVLAVCIAAWFAAGAVIPVLLERQFFSETPIPRQTTITAVECPERVGVGDSLAIQMRVDGRVPSKGTISVRYASGRKQELELLPDPALEKTFIVTIDSVPESFTWKARLNDARLARQAVTAIHRPSVTGVRLTQHYPEFMNLAPSGHEPGDFHLFPGATAELQIFSSKPIASGTLQLLGMEQNHTLDAAKGTPEDPLTATISVPLSGLSGFTVQLLDQDGMESLEPAAFRISLATDAPPSIQLVQPQRSEDTATPEATIVLGWKASDRFGIREFVLCSQIDGDEGSESDDAVHRQTVSIPEGSDLRRLTMQHPWKLTEMSPSPAAGSKMMLWVEAIDVNPATPPGVSRTFELSIVTPEEKRRQLLGRVSDALGRLESIASDQENLNEKLHEVIREH